MGADRVGPKFEPLIVARLFVYKQNMSLQPLPRHPNGMTLTAFCEGGDLLATNTYYSVGGGFVENDPTTCMSHDRNRTAR